LVVIRTEKKYFEKRCNLPESKIVNGLNNLGMPTEIEGEEYLIEVTPNRPDFYFVEGIIRTLDSYYRKECMEYKKKKGEYKIKVDSSVKSVRPHISSCVIKGLKIDDKIFEEIIEMQEKLHDTLGRKRKKAAIGVHNLDVIEFPLEYKIVKEHSFVPLEYSNEMSIGEILTKHPKGVGYAHLVEKGKYPLIVGRNGIVSFPPIINADRTKIDKNTKNLLIEATGMQKETVEGIVSMFACAFADLGAEIYSVNIEGEEHPELKYMKINVDEIKATKLLGKKINKKEFEDSLGKMGYVNKGGKLYSQPYRMDLMDEVDIVEDVAIGIGYDNFVPTTPKLNTVGSLHKISEQEDEIREIMNGMGFLEITTFTLMEEGGKKVLNPKTEDCGALRSNLFGSLLGVFKNNKMKGLPQMIYEVGDIYKEGVEKHLAVGIMSKNGDFNLIRAYAQRMMKEFGIKYEIKKNEKEGFEKGKCGVVYFKNKEIGVIGELNKEKISKFELENRVVCFEIKI